MHIDAKLSHSPTIDYRTICIKVNVLSIIVKYVWFDYLPNGYGYRASLEIGKWAWIGLTGSPLVMFQCATHIANNCVKGKESVEEGGWEGCRGKRENSRFGALMKHFHRRRGEQNVIPAN